MYCRVTFDDGLVRELEFLTGSNEGTVFGPLGDPAYFAQVPVNPESRWPNGLDLDPAVPRGDFEPAGDPIFAKWPLGASASWLTRNNIPSRRLRTTANLGARVAADSAVIRQGTHDLE